MEEQHHVESHHPPDRPCRAGHAAVAAGHAAYAAPANATDDAWLAYEAAKANRDANDQAYLAFEASIPVGPRPAFKDFEDRGMFDALADQWEK
jgi:hypothetical protein